jgi:methyl-accepting chemotaxis protein
VDGNVGKKTPETIKAENKLQSVVDRIIEGGDVGEKGPSATTPETAKAANILQSIVDKIVEGMPEIPVKDLTTDIDDIDKLIGTIDSIDNNKETGTSDSPTTSEGEK